jgi:lipopolysaccharide transport system ATP-binding protein
MSSQTVIQVDSLWKKYHLGALGTGALRHDFNRWWHRVRGKPDPYTKVDQVQKSAVTSDPTLADDEMWALQDVSLEVKQGEILGIIGRNGAGKSTLLKILSRVTAPTSGEVRVKGRIASLLEVGTGFHPELTGRENIFLNGAILGMTKVEIKRKLDEIVAFAEVEKFLDTPVKRYSSGMYVRLAFAVAAHLEPEILIVDEVLAVGDSAFQKKCLGKMGQVAGEGRTVLFVSHNMSVMQVLCRHIVLLRQGAVNAHGSPEEMITLYMGDADSSVDGTFDLRSHPARASHLKPIILEVRLLGKEGEPRTTFLPHSVFEAAFIINMPHTLREPRLALAIEDHLGRRILTVASYFSATPFPALCGRHEVRCTIPDLPLGAGRYLFSVSISEQGVGHLDSIDGVGWFQIEGRNPYGNGNAYAPAYGPVLCESRWRIA